ncbi:peptidyl-prolyl cis-trans isomerase [Plakobranchus ocellatus]|uniref:Peptidyl-prolyl cis-trans isomerase n=1 Tax=Plakobranchus ocellatus TaxID=259542 RepID=A0AAV4DK92_9GAST|nr:peptidyl-prolyl cis-trans isomerase [Plakobranchus ocellatus]
MCEGGDVSANGGKSIYGDTFPDENFILRHEPGSVAMSNSGKDSNKSRFYICLSKAEWMDGKHVVFGRVVSDLRIVKNMEAYAGDGGAPREELVISDCGMV